MKHLSRVCYVVAMISLVIGAAFHGYRLHPENVQHYNLGVIMGITMIIIFVIALVAGVILTIQSKKRK